jgi:predicted transcriptional regulator
MATTKMTFTLDQETATRLGRTADRLGMPKSMVVREAIREYAAHMGRLTEAERARAMATLDEIMARPPTRDAAPVDREIRDLRRTRRTGGRRTPPDAR